MAKTISLPEEVYELLRSRKKSNETFAQLILRMLGDPAKSSKNKESLRSFIGVFENDDEWDDIETILEQNRALIRSPLNWNAEGD